MVIEELLDKATRYATTAAGRIDGNVQDLEFVRRRVAGDGEAGDALDAGGRPYSA